MAFWDFLRKPKLNSDEMEMRILRIRNALKKDLNQAKIPFDDMALDTYSILGHEKYKEDGQKAYVFARDLILDDYRVNLDFVTGEILGLYRSKKYHEEYPLDETYARSFAKLALAQIKGKPTKEQMKEKSKSWVEEIHRIAKENLKRNQHRGFEVNRS